MQSGRVHVSFPAISSAHWCVEPGGGGERGRGRTDGWMDGSSDWTNFGSTTACQNGSAYVGSFPMPPTGGSLLLCLSSSNTSHAPSACPNAPAHLIHALAHDGRLGVGAKAQAVHHASRKCHNVLKRAAQLSARNIRHQLHVEVVALKELLQGRKRGRGGRGGSKGQVTVRRGGSHSQKSDKARSNYSQING
eukprot:361921-Chlamydomonas_euryale.AAC.17